MPEATNEQMQAYCDQRVRVRAEQFRGLYNSCKDDKLAIDDVYARSATNPPVLGQWLDARTDGPPHLLQSGYSAQDTPSSPDDIGVYNAFISAFLGIIDAEDGTNDAANAAALRNNWAVFQRACVRPVG